MASAKMLITIAIIAVLAPSALAKEFVVGNEKGWTINFDYQSWAAEKDFRVGDKLSTFNFPLYPLFLFFWYQFSQIIIQNSIALLIK